MYLFVHSGGSPVFSSLLHVRLSSIIGQVFPDLGNLLDAISPNGILSLEVGMILVGVKDHGDGSLITEGFITLPFDELIALSRRSFRSGTRSARGLTRL